MTLAGFDLSKQQGFYEKNPGADLPVLQLTRGTVTKNSKGLRLGRLPEIRNIIYEEMEKGFQGDQTAQQAMDNAVARGNKVLREFQKVGEGVIASDRIETPPPVEGGGAGRGAHTKSSFVRTPPPSPSLKGRGCFYLRSHDIGLL